jgi:acyl-CoA synthetase (AMP-forming)/AMP-acid ligase II/acyl carrier protein
MLSHQEEEYLQQQIDLVKSVLFQQPAIQDCAVLAQITKTGQLELIAYIVSSQPILPQKLQSSLEGVLRETRLPINFVPVSNLPRTASGEVDEEALRIIPVIDRKLAQEIEDQLKSRPEIDRVAVVVQDSGEKQPPLHLSDLLLNWQQQEALTSEETITENIPLKTPERELLSQAIADGGLLKYDPDTSTTLPQVLQKSADKIVGKSIIYLQRDGTEIAQSYAELLEEAQKILAGLRKQGLNPQDKVILQLENNWEIIPAFWGCILGGFVPAIMEVPPTYTESNPVANKLRQIWRFLDSPLIITNEGLQPKIQSFLPESEQKVSCIETLRQNLSDKFYYPSQPDETAFLNLTSGSTGIPKCVQLTHRNLISRARGANILNHHQPEEIILNWLPFDHIGSISDWHIRCVELGCQQIYAPKEYILGRALNWLDLIAKYQVTHSWAPNFAYSLMNDWLDREPDQTWDLSCVQFLLTAGEAVSSQAVEEFRKKMAAYGLKKTAIRPAFGMAELGSGITYYQPTAEAPLTFHRVDKSSLTGTIKRVGAEHPNSNMFADLGPVIPGVTMRIVDTENSVLPEDTIGRLQVSGDAVSPGYYNNLEANQTSFLEDGWFETGDLGFIRNGHLVVTGRAKETIIINGANYYNHEIEAVVEEIEEVEVSYTAACAVRDQDGVTDKLAIFFHTTTQNDSELLLLLLKIRSLAIAKIGVNPDYLIPVTRETIPKTAIGKIQRLQLSQRFETGEFNSILKQLDILLGNQNTLPDWFYRKIWRPKQLSRKGQQNTQGITLVFLDELGLGSYLCQTLPENCIAVEMGEEYIQKEKVYRINPTKPEHYLQLLESVGTIAQILHLWTYDEQDVEIPHPEALQQTQERGIYSLLFLVQALAKVRQSNQDVRLLWISSKSQATSVTEEIAPAKSPVLGLLKTIPQELPGFSTCHVDLLPDAVEVNGQYILQELKALSLESEVAYRDGQRLVCRLEKVDWHKQQQQELPFKPGGIYLLSGGLGGIGCEIAKYLLQNYQAKLLLVGKSPLREKRSVYQKLEQLQGEIVYEAVDIGNLEQLQPVVTQTLSQWGGELDGVIHLAGVYRDGLILESSVEQIVEVFRPKVLGTWVLHQLLKDKPDSIFIHFSSLASFFGGMAISAYSAANCFLESFAHYQRREGKLASYCLAWSSWQDIGISQGNKMQDVLRTKGYFAIGVEQGLFSLLAGLHYNQRQLLVGLEGCNRNIRPYIETKANKLQKLIAYFTSTDEGNESWVLSEFEICDRFGVETQCQFEQLLLMPLTEEGEIDRQQLLQNSNGKATAVNIAPRNELERQLASIWQEALEISTIGICDNFFELGGNSIKAMILVNKLQEELSEILHPVALFDAPTIAEFADYLQENYPEIVEKTEHQASVENLNPQQIDRMRQYLQHHLCGKSVQVNKSGQKNKQAIFILCTGRSGSTLLRVMMAGHPQLFAPPELYLLSFNRLAERKAAFSGRHNFLAEGVIRAIMEIKNCDGEQAQEIMEELEEQNLSTKEFFALMQSWLPGKIIADKTPPYAFNPQVLQRAEEEFENPLYIHLLRHPMATIRSIKEARLDLLVAMEEEEFSLEQKGELMWAIAHQNILEFLKNVPSSRQHQVKYEELVQHPQTTVNQLCEFIGVDFHADMLQPYQDKKQRMTDGVHTISRMMGDPKFHTYNGINAKVAERWKEEYNVDFLSTETWEIAASLGYERYDRPLNDSPSHVLPLTIGQEYMWWRLDPTGVYSNTWRIWRIEGELNLKALQEAIAEITRRHTPLHTTFQEIEGSVVQVVCPEMKPAFEVIDLPNLPETEDSQALWNYFEQLALRQFDLVNGPMVQVNVLRLSQTCHILMPCINHIAIDAWSWGIFINELNPLYSAFASGQPSPLPELPMTYTDFAQWYQQWLSGGVLEKSLDYWRKNLAGAQLLALPTDRPLPATPTFCQGDEVLKITPDLTSQLENISKQAGVVLYVTLLSAYGVVLASLANQEDFVIDANFSSRPRIEAQSLIGTFVNILPMRLNLTGDPTFAELLDRLQQTFRNGYAHNSLPFRQLVEIWQAQGQQFKCPISACFNLINATGFEQLELPGMKVSFIPMEKKALIFTLNLRMVAKDGGYLAQFCYMAEVFDGATVARIARKFYWLLEYVLTNSQKPISDLLVMLDQVELQQLE